MGNLFQMLKLTFIGILLRKTAFDVIEKEQLIINFLFDWQEVKPLNVTQ